jgi:glycosyltransferase involved in cell wall biosynthesis
MPEAQARGGSGLRFAAVLQTPNDPLSAVYIAYHSLEEQLRTAGHSLAIYTPGDFPGLRSVPARSVPLVYPAVVALWLRKHRRDFDLVLFHSYAGWLALSLPLGRRPRSVVAFHGLEPLYHRQLRAEFAAEGRRLSWRYRALQEILMPAMLRTSCRRADAVFCLNSQEVSFVVGKGWAKPAAVHMVPHGVGPEFFTPPRDPRPIVRLLFVGQWLPMKGIYYLADAVTTLMTRDAGLELVCAGTGRDADAVRARFPASLRSRITVFPRVDQATLAQIYRDADLFVFPSLSEGFSRAVIEAMAAGLPIVATDIAGDALGDEVNAIIVSRRDPQAIVRAVERLRGDPALAAQLGRAAAASAGHYRRDDRLRDTAHRLVEVAGGHLSTVS